MDEQIYQQCREIGIEIDDEGTFESNEARRVATSIAIRLIGWPAAITFPIWAALIAWFLEMLIQGSLIFGLLCGPFIVIMVTYGSGISIGWIAHRICWRTTIPVNRVAIAMAILFDLAMFGWLVVILSPMTNGPLLL